MWRIIDNTINPQYEGAAHYTLLKDLRSKAIKEHRNIYIYGNPKGNINARYDVKLPILTKTVS